ncbi:MAG TPA: hypothetical protein EYQ50_00505 [Verrucomicrobiales bacterium]|nr:hypothetical protein [Verrucomicrobiales bacterium]
MIDHWYKWPRPGPSSSTFFSLKKPLKEKVVKVQTFHRHIHFAGALCAFCCFTVSFATAEVMETTYKSRRSLILKNETCALVIDLAGGSLRDFHLGDSGINPLNWGWSSAEGSPLDEKQRAMGHFLCLDRWGPPSESEAKNGMPYHGEAANVVWKVEENFGRSSAGFNAIMHAELPLAGLSVQRSVSLAPNVSYALVSETVTNQNPLGRIYNMVQHPSIGPPFLTPDTIVDCNGQLGFAQGGSMPMPESPSFQWPTALNGNSPPVDMRRLVDNDEPNVVSYVVDEEYGWVTALNQENGLIIGYIWKTEHYPWIDLWRRVEEGKPVARGLEFGTTGLHQPFSILTEKLEIFNRPLFEHLDMPNKNVFD